jgi:transcriptional regulator with XRE-family HTH domain
MLQRVSAPGLAPSTFPKERTCALGTIVLALWPGAPAAELAKRAGCGKRAANLYINGKRKPSARVVLAILRELV